MLWRITGLSDFSAFMQKGHEESMWSVAEGWRTQFFDMPQLHAFGRDTFIQPLSSFTSFASVLVVFFACAGQDHSNHSIDKFHFMEL